MIFIIIVAAIILSLILFNILLEHNLTFYVFFFTNMKIGNYGGN